MSDCEDARRSFEGSALWQLEEELAAAAGLSVQRGGDGIERSAAVLSAETPATYRYMLTREWDPSRPFGTWLMLNPSVADGLRNDRTIDRCRGHARNWRLGGLVAVNAHALVSTDSDGLAEHTDPIGPHNEAFVQACTAAAVRVGGPVIVAWGAHRTMRERGPALARELIAAGVPLHCVKVTRDGSPGHPGRLAARLPLLPFEPATAGAGAAPRNTNDRLRSFGAAGTA